jgi:ABC-type amino acid transport substrate-binding protein
VDKTLREWPKDGTTQKISTDWFVKVTTTNGNNSPKRKEPS